MKDRILAFVYWFVTSSENRSKFALTLKAGIPFLVLLGVSDSQTLEELIGSAGVLLANIGEVIAAAFTAWGLLRKIWNSFK